MAIFDGARDEWGGLPARPPLTLASLNTPRERRRRQRLALWRDARQAAAIGAGAGLLALAIWPVLDRLCGLGPFGLDELLGIARWSLDLASGAFVALRWRRDASGGGEAAP